MKKFFLAAFIAAFSTATTVSVSAKVVLPHIFADNMVLQQQTDVNIWGTAKAKAEVTITPSWEGAVVVKVRADNDGNWKASVHTVEAGGPYTITISDGKDLVLENVLLGEVWLCSGQSNMAMRVRGNANQPVVGSAEAIMSARPEIPIRMCTVKKVSSLSPLDDCEMERPWSENTPEVVAETSAAAYFFAKYVNSALNVPVGIVVSCWGGSSIQTWIDKETISSGFPEFDLSYFDTGEVEKKKQNHWPALLYNAMLHPLIPFTIKGMIWYQGETNRGKPDQYVKLQSAFVEMLRAQFGVGDFPFYYVQIAPYRYKDKNEERSARFREAQAKSLELIPNSGMAVTLDIGDYECIHPSKKREVGQRLALLALQDTYGMEGIDAHSPIYKSWEIVDGKITVYFEVGEMGLAPKGHNLKGFEVAGEDRVFHTATAQIKGRDKVEVKCDEVATPVAVRYCFRECVKGTLFNNFGIPASSFRTDDW